ncbi:MAG: biotin--[acetyl-CoA-carboxylase] ligase, partial [Faecalibacterium sp.]|nr:biotin--[acetyl-CoA-carboxylase] ligase [Faecalibacterium sp.]
MKTENLKAIKEEAGFVSGQELCDGCGVPGTAVWKAIGKLKE